MTSVIFILTAVFYLFKKIKNGKLKEKGKDLTSVETAPEYAYLSYMISSGTFILITILGVVVSRRWSFVIELIMPAIILSYIVLMFNAPGVGFTFGIKANLLVLQVWNLIGFYVWGT